MRDSGTVDKLKSFLGPPFIFFITLLYLSACQSNTSNSKKAWPSEQAREDSTKLNLNTLIELSPEQDSALEALNRLQTSSLESNRIYSTFPGIHHDCYPADTSFTISQSELLKALKEFTQLHYQETESPSASQLATKAVKAQPEYQLLVCLDFPGDIDYQQGIPREGTWVLPKVLGRRDVLLVW